jgi:glucokinase
MRGFTDKGRFAPLLQDMTVCVALNPRAPLIGAAHFTLQL